MERQSLVYALDGHEGIFDVTKEVRVFWEHTSQKRLKDINGEVVKQIKKLSKDSSCSLDIMRSSSTNYKRDSYMRYIISNNWSNVQIDVRKFNGYDFSESTVYTFTEGKALFAYLKKELQEKSEYILGELQETDTYFGMLLRNELEEGTTEYELLKERA